MSDSKPFAGRSLFQAGAYLMIGWTLSLPVGGRAQVPQLLNFQGRVLSGGTNFDGTGQFKFSLVNSNGSSTFWSNDGAGSGGNPPAAPVALAVAKGLYSVLLGNATLSGMTLLPATVFTNSDVRLRIWFNDGANGFQLLAPDQRLAAVGYAMMAANVADGAITGAKLADGAVSPAKLSSDARAGLGGVSGSIVLSADPNAANLAASGFVRLAGMRAATEDWQQLLATTDLIFPTGGVPLSNYWNGSQVLLWNPTGGTMGEPVAARYHPGSNVWGAVATNGMPPVASPNSYTFWTGTEWYVFSTDAMMGLAAARYNPNSNVWVGVNTNGAVSPSAMSTVAAWTGTQLILWSPALPPLPAAQVQGARYNPTTDAWSRITTNGAPVGMTVLYSAWIGSEWLVLVDGAPIKSGAFYNPATDTWRPMNLAGLPAAPYSSKFTWTGSDLIYLVDNGGITGGAFYHFAVDAWYNLSTNSAPAFSSTDTRTFWTGSELIVWTPGLASSASPNGARFNLPLNRWTAMAPLDLSSPAANVSTVWIGTELIVLSTDYMSRFGARYSLQTGVWTLMQTYDMPAFSAWGSGLWTGSEILFFSTIGAMPTPKYVIKYTPSQPMYLYQKP